MISWPNSASNLKILGIDPGYDIVGWSVIGDGMKLVDYGFIKTSPSDPIEERLLQIHRSLDVIIREYSPDSAAVEKLFFNNNARSVMNVSRAIGVIILTLKLNSLPFHEYTPSQVKQSVTGFGHAEKSQVKFVIEKLTGAGPLKGPDDAVDSIGIALCHMMRSGIISGSTPKVHQ